MTRKSLALTKVDTQNSAPSPLPRDPKTGQLKGGKKGNSGGKPGRSGRVPREMLERQRYIAQVASGKAVTVAGDPTHPYWRTVYERSLDYALGKPEQRVSLKGGIELTIRKAAE